MVLQGGAFWETWKGPSWNGTSSPRETLQRREERRVYSERRGEPAGTVTSEWRVRESVKKTRRGQSESQGPPPEAKMEGSQGGVQGGHREKDSALKRSAEAVREQRGEAGPGSCWFSTVQVHGTPLTLTL